MTEPDEHEPEPLDRTLRLLAMTALGPITFHGAVRADPPDPDQFVAGLAGSILWFTIAMEVATHV